MHKWIKFKRKPNWIDICEKCNTKRVTTKLGKFHPKYITKYYTPENTVHQYAPPCINEIFTEQEFKI